MKRKGKASELSYSLALEVVRVCKKLKSNREFDLSRQLVRSGTSIAANLSESEGAETRKDFIHKLHACLKKARETQFWIRLLTESKMLEPEDALILKSLCTQIMAILFASLKTMKAKA